MTRAWDELLRFAGDHATVAHATVAHGRHGWPTCRDE